MPCIFLMDKNTYLHDGAHNGEKLYYQAFIRYLMHRFITLILLSSLPFVSSAQIEIMPAERGLNGSSSPAKINTSNSSPFWIGVGNKPSIHLDSSSFSKVGIGVNFRKFILFPNSGFEEHAKVHIRHAASLGNTMEEAGPQLLLDEATATNPAILRFRQSTLLSNPPGIQTMQPGLRYWDIKAFANNSTSGFPDGFAEWLRFEHPARPNAVLSMTGLGQVGINTDNPQGIFNVKGLSIFENDGTGTDSEILLVASNTTKINMGSLTQTSTNGSVEYNRPSGVMNVFTAGQQVIRLKDQKMALGGAIPFNPTSTLHVDGFSKLGKDAPKIKLFTFTMVVDARQLPHATYYTLPFTGDKILSISVSILDDESTPDKYYYSGTRINGALFDYWVEGDQFVLYTVSADAAVAGGIDEDVATVTVVYTE